MSLNVIIISLLSSILLGFGGCLSAQELERYLAEAIRNEPQLRALDLHYQAVQKRKGYVGTFKNPQLSMGAFVSPIETRVGPQLFRASVSQELPWFGTKEAEKNIVSHQADASYQAFLVRKHALEREMKSIWYASYRIQAKVKIHEEHIQLLSTFEKLALTHIEAGIASLTEVLQLQMDKLELQADLRNLKSELVPLQVSFNQYLGRQAYSVVNWPDSLPSFRAPIPTEIFQDSLRLNHPIYKQIQAERKVIHAQHQLSEIQSKPTLGVGLEYAWINRRSDVDVMGNGRDMLMPKVNISIPIFRKQYTAWHDEHDLQKDMLTQRLQQSFDLLEIESEQTFQAYLKANRNYELYTELAVRAKEIFDILITSYSTSGTHFEEMLEVLEEVLLYQESAIDAETERLLYIAKLEELQGK